MNNELLELLYTYRDSSDKLSCEAVDELDQEFYRGFYEGLNFAIMNIKKDIEEVN